MTTTGTGTVKAGDILVSAWGYDQTNIDFYEVVGVTPSGKSARLQRVGQVKADHQPGQPYHDMVIPNKAETIGDVFTKKIKPGWDGDVWFDLTSYSGARVWSGSPAQQTGAGYGH